jgi:hypothetical protein
MKKTALYVVALIGLLILLSAVTSVFSTSRAPVHAATSCPVSSDAKCLAGWAWSSNIGWVSFNSLDKDNSNANGNAIGGGPYDVSVDSSGNLGGYAWSSNVGWISFNPADVSDCTNASKAYINMADGSVTGFARVISGKGRTDGWNGCIELSGPNHLSASPKLTGNAVSTQGVSYNSDTGILSGFAWGDVNVGWLQFSPNVTDHPVCVNADGSPCPSGGGGITATCSIAQTSYTLSSGQSSATVVATVSGYSGGTAPYATTSATTFTLSAGTYNSLKISIKDSTGNTGQTSLCPTVTVTGGTGNPATCSIPTNHTVECPGTDKTTGPAVGVDPANVNPDGTCSLAGTSNPNNVCRFYCQPNYKLNAAKTACISSSLQEF